MLREPQPLTPFGPRVAKLYRWVNLTLSGNELTDTTRRTATQGDGMAVPDDSYGVWSAATNLITNGGFESNTTGWSTGGTNTIARSTEQVKFGTQSLKCTYQDNTTLASFGITLTAVAHSFSAWVYIPSDYDGTVPRLRFNGFTSATGTLFRNLDLTKRDQWQRVKVNNVTPNSGDLAGTLELFESGTAPTAGRFIYIDGAQCEALRTATPYIETNGSTAARLDARVQIPTNSNSLFTGTQGWIAFRFRVGWFRAAATLSTAGRIMDWRVDANNRLAMYLPGNGTNHLVTRLSGGAGANLATLASGVNFSDGDLLTIIYAWTASAIKVSENGGNFISTADSSTPDMSSNPTLDICQDRGSNGINSEVFWVATGSGTLDNTAAALIHSFGNGKVPVNAFPGTATSVWHCERGQYKRRASLPL